MAVAFDVKATAVTHQTTNTSPITNTLTVGASGTLVIGVFAGAAATAGAVPTAMTWNAVAMTLVSSKVLSTGTNNVYVYAIIAPATGLHTISCTYTNGTGVSISNDLDVFSFTGTDISSVANCIPSANVLTDATTPAGTVYPTSAFTVTTASGDAMVAVMNSALVGPTAASIGTIMNTEIAGTDNYGALRNLAVGVTTQGRFTINGSGSPCCGIAFRIIQPIVDVLMPQICM